MSSTPSFERFDYLLRTNKHIERKLVFDVLHAASRKIRFTSHWYLGFGSMWFGDFRLAHRLLGIDKLVSMEHGDYAPRAKFNRPFASVEVEAGESGAIMARLGDEAWSRPVVAWLDYDGHLNSDIVRDLDLLLGRAQPNSAIVVTVNGARGTYRVRRPGGATVRADTSVGVVEAFLGSGSVPTKYEPQQNAAGAYGDVAEAQFPQFLTEALAAFMAHRVVASAREVDGSRLTFVPLYRLHHRDGADMVTVGGALATAEGAAVWRECLCSHPILAEPGGVATYSSLDLIPITVKEKIALDECLPDPGDGSNFLAAARAAGLEIHDDEIAKYRKFYRHFPVFVETTM
jgi:hypothetical protein